MTLTLRNDIQDVPLLAAFIDEVCEAAGFNASLAMQMNLAMEEAVVNVMNYAYPVGVKGDIVIEAEDKGDSVQFDIIDGGTPFDPTAEADADTTLSAEERPIGGLGIFLVRQLMDIVSYKYKDGKNRLTLVKKKVKSK
jgi:sigma-B regulation protein RsbU (phosphoserine phosphatase)